jgi:hypothetical protein
VCPGGVPGHNTIANNYIANVDMNSIFFIGYVAECTASTPNLFSHNISDGAATDFSAGVSSRDTITPNPGIHQADSSFFTNYQTAPATTISKLAALE